MIVCRRLLPVLLLVPGSLYLMLGYNRGLNIYDEGLILYGAARILDGDIPYRDFWTIYAPGHFYVVAGLLKLFGRFILVERLWSVVNQVALVALVYAITRSLVSARNALLAGALTTILLGSIRFLGTPVPTSLVFILFSYLLLIRWFHEQKTRRVLLCGVACGAAILFRHDLGGYTLIGEGFVMLAFVWTQPIEDGKPGRRLRRALGPAGWFLLGLLISAGPPALYFVAKVPMSDLISDLIVFPTRIFAEVRSLPYPLPIPNPIKVLAGETAPAAFLLDASRRVPYYLPLVVLPSLMVYSAWQLQRKRTSRNRREYWAVLLLSTVDLLNLNQARVRSEITHLMPALILTFVMISVLLRRAFSIVIRRRRNILVGAIISVILLYCVHPFYNWTVLLEECSTKVGTFSFDRGPARGIRATTKNQSYRDAIDYIREQVPEGERIFVGNKRHDKVVVSDVMFYFLAGRHSATGYYEGHPGLTTTAEVQRWIVSDIEKWHVNNLVRVDLDFNEPNASAISSHVFILDRFIADNYQLDRKFGIYEVYKRKTPFHRQSRGKGSPLPATGME